MDTRRPSEKRLSIVEKRHPTTASILEQPANRCQLLIIWYVTDDKPGHINQILGLIDALERQLSQPVVSEPEYNFNGVKAYVFSTRQQRRTLFKNNWSKLKALFGFVPDISLPAPNLIIGAGHATHCTVLAASRAYKIPSVILMKPSLPVSWFDYLIVPEHDGLENTDNVLTIRGAINRMQPQQKMPQSGLILLGGPSKHYIWDEEEIVQQFRNLIAVKADVRWKISTSRRTPKNFEDTIDKIMRQHNNLKLIKFDDCEKNWLKENLPQNEQVWVTPDSVSMIFEALSSGADVGIFEMRSTHSKVSKSIADLVTSHQVTTLDVYIRAKEMFRNDFPLNEGEKAARWLLEKISNNNATEK
ncbi:MAG TPA: hypothetical protein ENJ60_07900 [Aeromonadales bacterium]|nr:hypothetical protein [Aeromonadales bacterium]